MLSCALEDSGVPEQHCTEREGEERKLERRDSLLNALRHVKLKNAIFFVQCGSWPRDESSTKTARKPYENRTKTVKAPYRESYSNFSKPPHENRNFSFGKIN